MACCPASRLRPKVSRAGHRWPCSERFCSQRGTTSPDVRMAEALDDRASFRRFCGFAAHEPTPERTAFVRFRAELVRRGLDRALFETVTRQLDQRGVVVRTGTLVDATLIPPASTRHDGEARWAGHRRRKPVHGYKAHIATDQEAGLIRGVEIT